ncbi:MAG: hypothetical protein ACREEW_13005 [Caulobacteraceae bacterium]
MVRRGLCGLLALAMGLNGLVMLWAGPWWYGAVPGVPATGPFNPHFVMDIGAAYLAVGGGFGWFAATLSTAARGAAGAGALFLCLHACIHLAALAHDPAAAAHALRDFPGVYLPALLSAALVLPALHETETRHAQSLA